LLRFSSQEFQFDILQNFCHYRIFLAYISFSFSFAFYLNSFRCLFMFSLVSLIILFHSDLHLSQFLGVSLFYRSHCACFFIVLVFL
jgi:hypothetical protein